jgi:ribose transport system ATP-binding protein
MTDIVLAVDRVSKRFGRHAVLDEVSLAVRAGSIHALVGENGAGKSTLMNVVGGLVRADSGRVRLDGYPVAFADPAAAIRAGISTVHQEFSLFSNRSVAENIFARREPTTRLGFIRRGDMRRAAADILAEIGLDLDPDAPVGAMGVGAQQLVEIAKALSLRARVLILDEPTSALSESDSRRLFVVLDRLRARGVAIVYISHRLPEVLQISDEIAVLRDGRLVGRTTGAASVDALVGLMVGRIEERAPTGGAPATTETVSMETPRRGDPRKSPVGPVVLSADGLARRGAFADVTFDVRAGEILGFAGLVGSGRTEVARAVFGADRLEAGHLALDGRTVRFRSPRQAIDAGVAYLTEDRRGLGLFLPMRVRDNIVAASLSRLVTGAGLIRSRTIGAESARLVERLDIRPPDDRVEASRLSGGNQQKVLLARWLSAEPRVLIVDEPTRGVDARAKDGIHRHLRDLAGQGMAIVLISSDLLEVLGLSDRVAVFRGGRLVATLSGVAATQEDVMRYASA